MVASATTTALTSRMFYCSYNALHGPGGASLERYGMPPRVMRIRRDRDFAFGMYGVVDLVVGSRR
jgi:hypothetical protein